MLLLLPFRVCKFDANFRRISAGLVIIKQVDWNTKSQPGRQVREVREADVGTEETIQFGN